VSVDNVLLAIEEKRKWERRLDAVAGELAALRCRRKEILMDLALLKTERSHLLEELAETCDIDLATLAAKHSSGPGNISQR